MNKEIIKLIFICIAIFCYTNLSWGADDWEVWFGNTVKVKVNDRANLNFLEEFHINEDMGKFYTYELYFGPSYEINKYMETAIWYKFVESKNKDHWQDSHRYDMDFTLKYDLQEFKLSNRSRFENNVTKSSWLYRDRIKIAKDLKTLNKKYTPYIFNEFFLDIDPDEGYHENRAGIGALTGFFFDTELNVYYMARTEKKYGNWKNANILGVSVGMSF